MSEREKSSAVKAAEQRMEKLYDAAWEAYRDQQHLRAAELFAQGREIAESISDTRLAIKFRSWQGASFIDSGGRLQRALAVLTPTLQTELNLGDANDVYRTLIRYIEIAQRLPISLASIEKVYAETERFLRDTGHYDWRHRILLIRGELLAERGIYKEALKVTQESWIMFNPKHPAYAIDDHFYWLVKLSIYLRDSDQAGKYLIEWERQENTFPKDREVKVCQLKSSLARLNGAIPDAIDWARQAIVAAEQRDRVHEGAVSAIIRAFLSSGDIKRAGDFINKYFTLRHSEMGVARYNVRLLQGDYHFACAREAVGAPPFDDEFGLKFVLPECLINSAIISHEIHRAQNAYDSALKIGQWVDTQLQCDVRQQEISSRYSRLNTLKVVL